MDAEPSSQASSPHAQRRRSIKTGTWHPTEDDRLREAVARHGARWVLVANDVGTRNGDQCAKRWNENLNPKLVNSAWSLEDEQRLLSSVNLYGHNWKFISDSFFETRAPLALKNRYSLLKRRSKRQRSRQNSPHSARSSRSGVPQFDPSWLPASGSVPSSRNSVTDLAALSMDDQLGSMPVPACGLMDFIPSTTLGTMDTTGTAITSAPSLPRAGDQSLDWSNSSFDNTTSPFAGTFMIAEDIAPDAQMSNFDMHPASYPSTPWPASYSNQADVPSSASLETLDREADSMGTEYSVTCSRDRLRTVVNHLVDAAIAENAEGAETDTPVTLKLRLQV